MVNNVVAMVTPEGRTEGGLETQFETYHLGHVLLFQLLKQKPCACQKVEIKEKGHES